MKKRYFTYISAVAIACLLTTSVMAAEGVTIPLPDPITAGGRPFMEVLTARQSSRSFASPALEPQTLSNVLYAAYGISHNGMHTIPTAKNEQNLSVYVFNAEGVWKYNPQMNGLLLISEQDQRALFNTQSYMQTVPLILVYTGSDPINSPMQAGAAFQNVGLYAANAGLSNVVRGYFDKQAVKQALNLPPDEQVIISQAVGQPE